MGKISVGIILAILIATSIAPAVLAADVEENASIGGQVYVLAAAPTVTVKLYSDDQYSQATTEITPQTPVYLKLDIAGDTPLGEALIYIDFFADNTTGGSSQNLPTISPEKHVQVLIQYDANNNKWTLTILPQQSTWSIQFDPNKQLPNPDVGTGTFYLIVVFGKTAREAADTTTETTVAKGWDIVAKVIFDSGRNTAEATGSQLDNTVYFYSEVTANAQTIDFGSLQPRSSSNIKYVVDTNGVNNTADSFTITVIANGFYDLKVASDQTWTNQDGKTMSLVAGNPGSKEFSLQFDDNQDDNNQGWPANPVYAVTPDNLASATPFVDDAQPTTESGVTYTIYGAINLGYDIYTGKYTGTIYFYAVDGK